MTNPLDERRLYGLPDAENLHSDPLTVWHAAGVERDVFVRVEEWSTHPPTYHLPSPERVVEDLLEKADEVDEHWVPDVTPLMIRAARVLLDTIAMEVPYRMVNELLATWDVWVDHKGELQMERVESHVEPVG